MKKFYCMILFLFLLSCSSTMSNLKVRNDYDPMADFSKLKTYAYMPGTGVHYQNKNINNDFVNSRIQKAVDREMKKKGFVKTTYPKGSPDVWVAYYAVLEKKTRSKRRPMTHDVRDLGSPGLNYYVSTTHYDEGTLLLDLVNPKTSRPVWKAVAQAEIKMDVSWKDKEKRINRAVQEILQDYPPQE